MNATETRDYYPQGVTVVGEVLESGTDETGRKWRRVKTVRAEFSADTPKRTRDAYNRTVGRTRKELYFPADRYESARWVMCGY